MFICSIQLNPQYLRQCHLIKHNVKQQCTYVNKSGPKSKLDQVPFATEQHCATQYGPETTRPYPSIRPTSGQRLGRWPDVGRMLDRIVVVSWVVL